MVVLVTGGAASGKSEFAEKVAVSENRGRMAYLATMHVCDDECAARVAKHRKMRAGKGFETIECQFGIPKNLYSERFDTALLECMSNFVANVMFISEKSPDETVLFLMDELKRLCQTIPHVVIVTNEVFSDSGDYDSYTRSYIKTLGTVNQRIAAIADTVIESVCGIPVFHKGKEELSAYENIF